MLVAGIELYSMLFVDDVIFVFATSLKHAQIAENVFLLSFI